MATQRENEKINELRTDVAVIKSTQITFTKDFKEFKEEVRGNQKDIIERMDEFSFVNLKDYEDDKKSQDTRFKSIEDELQSVRWFFTFLKNASGRVGTVLTFVLVSGGLLWLANQILKYIPGGGTQ